MVQEEIGERHVVAAPAEQQREQQPGEERVAQGLVPQEEAGDEVGDDQQAGEHRALNDQQHRHQRDGRQHPPARAALGLGERQEEQQHHHGAQVHRTRGEALVAPVVVDVAATLVLLHHRVAEGRIGDAREVGLALHDGTRGTALGVGHQQREALLLAVAPIGHVVAVQALGADVVRGTAVRPDGQFALPAGGVLAILPGAPEQPQVAAGRQHHGRQAQQRALHEAAQGLLPEGAHPLGQREEHQHDAQVVGDLHVVHADLQPQEQGEQGRSQQLLAPV